MDCALFASRGHKLGYGQDSSTLLLTRGYGNSVASQNVGNQFQKGAATLQMRMNPNEIGRKLGIGVRVAGRIAQQRAQDRAAEAARTGAQAQNYSNSAGTAERPASIPNYSEKVRDIGKSSHKLTRAAGRGVGGFLRPFGRVGGILWLEVTGFFFGLFALYFAQDLWRTRLSYIAGPQHSRFWIAAAMTTIFGYLSVSAFWRAKRK
jgi:hypothetical protein